MEYRNLGRSGLKVSTLCLGTMMFGDRTNLEEADRILGSARDHGVNFIDTADQYSKGGSEVMVGQLIARDRDAAARVRRILERRPPNNLARFYEPAIDLHGMSISVL